MTKIAIIHYSMYGHVATLSESIKKGVEAAGAECDIYQVPETLSDEVLSKMHAPPKGDYPIIDASKMTEYDGYLFGLAGRFGTMPAQMKAFMDSTGSLWQSGALAGKAAGTFVSVGSQGGGQETVNLSMIPFLVHQGMVYVPLGFADKRMSSHDEVHGASAYGSGTFAGDGSRQPTDLEKGICETHGKLFAKTAAKLAGGEVQGEVQV